MAWEALVQQRCLAARQCAASRQVKQGAEAGQDPNAAARRGLDFWAFLERENRRHPGTVQSEPNRAEPRCHTMHSTAASDGRPAVSYGMPKLGEVPGPATAGGSPPPPAPAKAPIQQAGREVFTPIGTRLDILA